MKLLHRRILLLVIIIFFVIITPIILLYAQGFRYDFKQNKLIKVGLLYIETTPKTSSIYLNDKLIKKNTPVRLNNLIPGEYNLKVEKDGYFDWEKNVKIEPESASIYNDIILFKNNKNIQKLSDDNIKLINSSPDLKKIIYLINDQNLNTLKLFNTNSGNTETVKTILPANIDNIIWSADSKKILIRTSDEKYFVYDIGNNQFTRLSDIFENLLSNVKWSDDVSFIYAVSNNKLYKINYSTSEKEILLDKEMTDYQISNNYIYYTEGKNNNIILNKYDVRSKDTINLSIIENSEKIVFKDCPLKNYILLHDEKNQILYIFNKDSDKLIEKFPNKVKDFSFSSDNKKILYFNDYEIWIYDIENGENNLITRSLEIISQAVFHPLQQNIIYLKNSQINIIEVSGPIRNNYELTANADNLICDLKGENIYFLLNENDKKILSTVNIR